MVNIKNIVIREIAKELTEKFIKNSRKYSDQKNRRKEE